MQNHSSAFALFFPPLKTRVQVLVFTDNLSQPNFFPEEKLWAEFYDLWNLSIMLRLTTRGVIELTTSLIAILEIMQFRWERVTNVRVRLKAQIMSLDLLSHFIVLLSVEREANTKATNSSLELMQTRTLEKQVSIKMELKHGRNAALRVNRRMAESLSVVNFSCFFFRSTIITTRWLKG